jgi:PAS domain S-box-containing protein
MENILNQFNTWADSLNISSNSGVFLMGLAAALLIIVVLFVLLLIFAAKKRRFAKKHAESEAVVAAVYEVMPDMIVCKDMDDRFTKCNDAFAKFAGADEAQLVGRSLSDMLEMVKRLPASEIVAADRKSLTEGMKIKTPPHPLQFPDGSYRYYESIRAPLICKRSKSRKKGGTMGILCVFRDVNDANECQTASELAAEELALVKTELLLAKTAAFCHNALKHIAAMGAALSDEDYALYSVHVATIRRCAFDIGVTHIFARAELLEDAVTRKDIDYIKANHPDFISELSTLLAELDK